MIQLDPNDVRPLHERIAAAIEKGIADGTLRADRPLPSVRALAERLSVSTATAASAYRDLVARGAVEARQRSGYRAVVRAMPASYSDRAELPMHRIEPRLAIHPVAEFGALIAEEAAGRPDSGGYEDYRGNAGLRAQLRALNEEDGIPSDAESGILVSGGAQHAIALAARCYGAGKRVALEDPAYPGARIAFAAAGARLRGIPMTGDGPDTDELENRAKTEGIDLFYCCPTYGNPSGVSWSMEKRERVVDLALKYGFRILEDDYLRDLDYLNEGIAPLAAIAAGRGVRVIHVRTFSKCLLPALRIAGISADGGTIDRLLSAKTADDICGSALLQRPLARFLERGDYRRHLERVRPAYSETRAALRVRAARAENGLRFEDPKAGLCLLGTLPEDIDSERFADACRAEGVLVSPGGAYWADAADGARRFRIGFGSLRPEDMEKAFGGMERAVERVRSRSMENFFKRALL